MTDTKTPTKAKAKTPAKTEDGVTETKINSLTLKSNTTFKVVDNTDAEATPPPKAGKASARKDKLNGFKVVDYK